MAEIQQRIEEKLRSSFDIKDLIVRDQSGGCGQSFLCIVIAEEFKIMKLLERQQKVNEVLSEEIS